MSTSESIRNRRGVDRRVTERDIRRSIGVAPAVDAMVPATNGTIAPRYCGVHHSTRIRALSRCRAETVRFDSHPRAGGDRYDLRPNGRMDGDLRETRLERVGPP